MNTAEIIKERKANLSPTVFICSNTRMDYIRFLQTCIASSGTPTESITYLNEETYRKKSRGSRLLRIWLRVQLYLLYPAKLLFKTLRSPSNSLFVVSSNTFFAPLLVSMLGKFKSHKTIHLLYDLYPDALIVAGKTSRKSMLSKLVGKTTEWTQKSCSGTVYLGTYLSEHAEYFYGKSRNKAMIDVSADDRDNSAELKAAKKPIIFHYGGQIGHMHDAETVIAAISNAWQDQEISCSSDFRFFVSGAQSEYVRKSFTGTSIKVIPAIPSNEWKKVILDFHVGLVSIKPGAASVCLPSKTYGMMAGGLAIVAVCPLWSDLAKLILENDAGWIVSNSPYSARPEFSDPRYFEMIEETRPGADTAIEFSHLVKHILNNPSEVDRKRNNARSAMRTTYSCGVISSQWADFLSSIADGSSRQGE